MEAFNQLFEDLLRHPNKIQESTIYNSGIDIVLETEDIQTKEDILSKLIFLFPDKYELYYFMGHIFLHVNTYKSLTWFKLCLKNWPIFQENVLDYTKILFEKDFCEYIVHSNSIYDDFLYKSTDIRVNYFVCCLLVKLHKLKTAETQLIELDKRVDELISTNQNPYTNIDLVAIKLYVCTNLAYIYMTFGNHPGFFYYTNIVTTICEDPTVQSRNYTEITRIAFQNCASVYNYIYDDEQRYKICRFINSTYDITNSFTFSNREPVHTRKICIGYVSGGGLANHAVTNFITPILENHDYSRFDVFLYTERTCNYSNCHTIDIYNKKTEDCTNMIYKDGIDILIDLDGYTTDNRLDIFSKNPAQIQVTYLGYPNTLGIDFIKYRITDNYADPTKSTQIYTEQLLRMSRCFLLYRNIIQEVPLNYRPCDPSRIVLGSLNRENKLNNMVLSTWKKIMALIPNTFLMIKLDSIDDADARLLYYSSVLEVPQERLIIIKKGTNKEYLEMFYNTDILLDTFPYSGTTTSCNALYNSIPIVTMYRNSSHVHNVTSSLLYNCGLGELVTHSTEEYIKKVVELCQSPDMINNYKKTIGAMFSKLMNPSDFMKDYEKIFTDLVADYYSHI
jgi:predicted O-linked N-acetylglucosamine transferase (SPINDLY family)